MNLRFSTAPIIAYLNYTKEIIVDTDTSDKKGAVFYLKLIKENFNILLLFTAGILISTSKIFLLLAKKTLISNQQYQKFLILFI